MQVSVILITYNSDIKKAKQTAYSIINQKGVELELIVADDGSKDNISSQLEVYLKESGFSNYRFVNNPVNQGTVKNILGALETATGEYTKVIAPGDYLYDFDTLKSFYDYARTNDSVLVFGNAIYYGVQKDNITFYDKHNPRNIKVYRQHNAKKIRRNYLIDGDNISGAHIFFRTADYLENVRWVSQYAKYAEDFGLYYMAAKDVRFDFYDRDYMWYEYGTGISTSSTDKWAAILKQEIVNVYHQMEKEILIPSWICTMLYTGSFVQKLLLRLVHNPAMLFRAFGGSKVNTYTLEDKKTALLKDILNNKNGEKQKNA